jgi:hypothetical protein
MKESLKKNLKKILIALIAIIVVVGATVWFLFFYEQKRPESIIPNYSLEQAQPNEKGPEGWKQGSWGENNAAFGYLDQGYRSNRALRVELTNYKTGDAKWYFDEIPVIGGQMYYFENYYKSNTNTEVIAAMKKSDDKMEYVSLGKTAPSDSWRKFSTDVKIPEGVKSVSIYHLINQAGTLSTDSYYFQVKPQN